MSSAEPIPESEREQDHRPSTPRPRRSAPRQPPASASSMTTVRRAGVDRTAHHVAADPRGRCCGRPGHPFVDDGTATPRAVPLELDHLPDRPGDRVGVAGCGVGETIRRRSLAFSQVHQSDLMPCPRPPQADGGGPVSELVSAMVRLLGRPHTAGLMRFRGKQDGGVTRSTG